MDYSEKVKYLSAYASCIAKISALQTEKEKWEVLGEKITQTLSFTSSVGGENSSKIERASIEMAEIQKEIDEELRIAKQKRNEIKDAIVNKSKRVRHAELLSYRYINGLSNYQIARIIKKSTRTVDYAMKNAIEKLDI